MAQAQKTGFKLKEQVLPLHRLYRHTPGVVSNPSTHVPDFIFNVKPNVLYLLKGYAGTGKTSIIGTIVSNLWQAKISAILLAPTGRAAKVISNYSKKEAFTIRIRKVTAEKAGTKDCEQ